MNLLVFYLERNYLFNNSLKRFIMFSKTQVIKFGKILEIDNILESNYFWYFYTGGYYLFNSSLPVFKYPHTYLTIYKGEEDIIGMDIIYSELISINLAENDVNPCLSINLSNVDKSNIINIEGDDTETVEITNFDKSNYKKIQESIHEAVKKLLNKIELKRKQNKIHKDYINKLLEDEVIKNLLNSTGFGDSYQKNFPLEIDIKNKKNSSIIFNVYSSEFIYPGITKFTNLTVNELTIQQVYELLNLINSWNLNND